MKIVSHKSVLCLRYATCHCDVGMGDGDNAMQDPLEESRPLSEASGGGVLAHRHALANAKTFGKGRRGMGVHNVALHSTCSSDAFCAKTVSDQTVSSPGQALENHPRCTSSADHENQQELGKKTNTCD